VALSRTGPERNFAEFATKFHISTYYLIIRISRGKGIWYFSRPLLESTVTCNITLALGLLQR
jgi:hypothetical protein